eukprot:TRINITY_DN8056_c0_g1_i1.p1 TRINITY_DN8056_c0_g1~~TRINITY_DN8056_c0_g1_i1.p1  ORF type:complete len:219 (+),score=72.03 TRINITY_DN8056_c0_g1_i1:134-790(+)
MRRTTRLLCAMEIREALKVFGMDEGMAFPRGKSGVFGQAALVGATRQGLQKRYKELARVWHPDQPTGDKEEMSKVNQAYDLLRTELPSFDNPMSAEEARRSEAESDRYEKASEETFRSERDERQSSSQDFTRGPRSHAYQRAARGFDDKEYFMRAAAAQKDDQDRYMDMLRRRARQEQMEKYSTPPPETDPIKAQLKKENGGSIRKKSNVKAKSGSWM